MRWPVGARAVLGFRASAAEIMLFDRSWYNRAGVEHVIGSCSSAQRPGFLRVCSGIERMVINSGTHLIQYWLKVSQKERATSDGIPFPNDIWMRFLLPLPAERGG